MYVEVTVVVFLPEGDRTLTTKVPIPSHDAAVIRSGVRRAGQVLHDYAHEGMQHLYHQHYRMVDAEL